MAAECAILGVPAIHVSTRRLWYTDELEAKYHLVYNVETSEAGQALATRILQDSTADTTHRRQCARYLETTDNLITTVLSSLDEVVAQPQT
jgi:predicted glycosyltransferase